MGKCVNILDKMKQAAAEAAALGLVRLGESQTALIPFTAEGEEVEIHYCEEADIRGYVRCNGTGCALCRAGKSKEPRTLLPVYLPASREVAVLPVSPSLRPNALLPQLAPALGAGEPVVVFVSRDRNYRHEVSVQPLPEGADAGESAIAAFRERYEAGQVELASVYQRLPDDLLAKVPGIACLLQLKGEPPCA